MRAGGIPRKKKLGGRDLFKHKLALALGKFVWEVDQMPGTELANWMTVYEEHFLFGVDRQKIEHALLAFYLDALAGGKPDGNLAKYHPEAMLQQKKKFDLKGFIRRNVKQAG